MQSDKLNIYPHYKVKDCILHINTGLNPRDNFTLTNSGISYITVKNLTKSWSIDFTSCDYVDAAAKNMIDRRSQVSKGDILFASIAPLGRCYLVQETPHSWAINESVFSIRPNTKLVSAEFLFLFLTSDYFVKKAEHTAAGSLFGGIRISTLGDIDLNIPPCDIMQSFTDKVRPILKNLHEVQEENNRLIALRNFLLPLLMNGQAVIVD